MHKSKVKHKVDSYCPVEVDGLDRFVNLTQKDGRILLEMRYTGEYLYPLEDAYESVRRMHLGLLVEIVHERRNGRTVWGYRLTQNGRAVLAKYGAYLEKWVELETHNSERVRKYGTSGGNDCRNPQAKNARSFYIRVPPYALPVKFGTREAHYLYRFRTVERLTVAEVGGHNAALGRLIRYGLIVNGGGFYVLSGLGAALLGHPAVVEEVIDCSRFYGNSDR